jgi:hypothetical protein
MPSLRFLLQFRFQVNFYLRSTKRLNDAISSLSGKGKMLRHVPTRIK